MAYLNVRANEVPIWGGGGSGIFPPGEDYCFEVEAAEQKASEHKGAHQLHLSVRCLAGENTNGRKHTFRYNANFDSTQARSRMKSLGVACGVPWDAAGGFDDQQLVGCVFMADVVGRSYDKLDPVTGVKTPQLGAELQNERPIEGAPQQVAVPVAAPVVVARATMTPRAVSVAPTAAPAAASRPAVFPNPRPTTVA